MTMTEPDQHDPLANGGDVYRRALRALLDAGVPFLLGGAFALQAYTRIARDTKDIDLFVRHDDLDTVLAVLSDQGFEIERTFPHWLAKARHGQHFADIIHSSGNGISPVDDEWFANARPAEVLGLPLRLCPPEEMLWTKAFIMERERYDGADVAHLLREMGRDLDWERLVRRFGRHWRVLFSHVVLFGYIYPNDRLAVPDWVIDHFSERVRRRQAQDDDRPLCCGTFLSRTQYIPDIEDLGYIDVRTIDTGTMSDDDAERWTTAGRRETAVAIAAQRATDSSTNDSISAT